jgi:hypothetical protein
MPSPDKDEDREDDDNRPRRRRRREDEEDEEDDDQERPRRRRRRRQESDDATQFLVPTDVSAWSLIACYAGAIGCVLPCFTPPALVCAIVALWQRRKKKTTGSYGSVTSDIRAIIGLVCSLLTILGWIVILVYAGIKK